MIEIKKLGRSCGECTKCCEGWLSGVAYGYEFKFGTKCKFLGKGCNIYPYRPSDPCKTFECEYKRNLSIPEWLKPDKSGVIIIKRYLEDIPYYRVVYGGKKIDQKIYDWAEEYSKLNIKNNVIVDEILRVKIFSVDERFIALANEAYKIK